MAIHQLKTVPPAPTTKEPIQLLKEVDVAKRLNVSISSLRRWRYEKIGPKFIRIGGILRYRVTDVDEFIQKHISGEME